MRRAVLIPGLILAATACTSSTSGTGDPDGGSGSSSGGSGSSSGGSGSSSGGLAPSDGGGLTVYGSAHSGGQYNLGPVDWQQSHYTNSCGPYPSAIQTMEGAYLAGVDNSFNGDGHLCDACILMTTAKGRSLVLRVITTGVSNTPNDADLSPEAFNQITEGEYPRSMSWQVVECPDTGKIQYQYESGANVYWTAFFVRNARIPVAKVEVISKNHSSWFALARDPSGDGRWLDSGGFGDGAFQLRVTGVDGRQITDSFPSFTPGATVASTQQL